MRCQVYIASFVCALVTIALLRGSTFAAPDAGQPGPAPAAAAPLEETPPAATPAPAAPPAPREATPEIIVVTPRPRARGVDDLVDADPAHADRERALGDSAFVTVVRLDERAGESITVADVLARSLGVSVRNFGGLGAFSSLSVRGASSGHTTVFVDGVPLSKLASTTADLGKLELGGFSTLELYRGGVPAELGGAGAGGALALSTVVGPAPDGRAITLSTGAGSHGARHLRARWLGGTTDRRFGFHLAGGYRGADGDFDFFDDNATPLEPGDDTMRTRENNGYDRLDYVARLRWQDERDQIAAGARGVWQAQGVPGPGFDQSLAASLDTAMQIVDLSFHRDAWLGVDGLSLRSGLFGSIERQRYRDPDDEIGLRREDLINWTRVAGARAGSELRRGRHRASASLDLRGDFFLEDDRATDDLALEDSDGRRAQLGFSLGDEVALMGGRLVVEPALRLDALVTDPISDRYDMDAPVEVRRETFASPRLSARVAATDWMAIKSNGGRYVRVPTLLESFGDRGYLVGNRDLRAETGWSADLGVVVAPARSLPLSIDRVYAEATAFVARPRDPIVFASQNGLVARARNLEGADIAGLELAASARVARALTISASYDLLDARHRSTSASLDGKRLPHRPSHELYARADLAAEPGGRLAVLFADLLVTSGNFLDEANVYELPRRVLVGVGGKLELPGDAMIGVEVENLLGARVEDIELDPAPRPDLATVPRGIADFYGYPLPGRVFYLTVEWRH